MFQNIITFNLLKCIVSFWDFGLSFDSKPNYFYNGLTWNHKYHDKDGRKIQRFNKYSIGLLPCQLLKNEYTLYSC